jgi:hypothetical protein
MVGISEEIYLVFVPNSWLRALKILRISPSDSSKEGALYANEVTHSLRMRLVTRQTK